MNTKQLTTAVHLIVWLLLLVIPYISSNQVFESAESNYNLTYLLLCLAMSVILLAAFYLNYFYLIPHYLFSKKRWLYPVVIIPVIAIVFLLLGSIFIISGVVNETLIKTGMAVEKIIPVILINAVSLWLLSIGSSILFAIYNRLREAENERLSAQIASLKSQINPHFLFNTLNNIYATAIDTSPKAADMIDKLSEMMRYTMKETQRDLVPLEDEINYINNFIELQKLRLDKSVKIECDILKEVPLLQIAPMLLIPFIENAFKHGVNSEQKSHIKIEISMNNNDFQLIATNNKVNIQREISERSGLGIENTKHRLNLIYPSKHLLVINDTEKQFTVTLYINLK